MAAIPAVTASVTAVLDERIEVLLCVVGIGRVVG
jgi:hypothetical protein